MVAAARPVPSLVRQQLAGPGDMENARPSSDPDIKYYFKTQ